MIPLSAIASREAEGPLVVTPAEAAALTASPRSFPIDIEATVDENDHVHCPDPAGGRRVLATTCAPDPG
ncbi:hypothetical protein DP939_12685 [Spongiactinospora rosea]|uniref:Uncharacterized protein n=1 Tax=Spongiactinospora rosea TaxID=2248750 RepID=A0A366M1U7_9ACTN|nr:hypothetical protein [Spongiactinospora rosea]RBQ19599.1 hypothetical protein DP939_12685 [Spongiactinospora rosea]